MLPAAKPGSQRVHPYAELGELDGETLGQSVQSCLGCAIWNDGRRIFREAPDEMLMIEPLRSCAIICRAMPC